MPRTEAQLCLRGTNIYRAQSQSSHPISPSFCCSTTIWFMSNVYRWLSSHPSPPWSSIDFGVFPRPWAWRFPESKQRFYTGCWLSHIWQISKVPAQAVNIKISVWNQSNLRILI
jgi:hypothetical protein